MSKSKKLAAYAGVLLGLLLMIAGIAAYNSLPGERVEKPTGDYAIGSVSYHWTDSSRKELYTADPEDNRQLMVQVWYPAQKDAKGSKMKYYPDYNDLKPLKTKLKFWKEYLYNNKWTHSVVEAPIAEDSNAFPVVLFTHGMGSSRFFSTYQFEELASQGFIVVSVEHTFFTNSGTLFPDGSKLARKVSLPEDYGEAGLLVRDVWAKDASFVLDRVLSLNEQDPKGILEHKVDPSRVAIMGHSFGGANAAYVLSTDNRFKAGINLDGFPYGTEGITSGLQQPFMWMHTERLPLLESSQEYMEKEVEAAKAAGRSIEQTINYPKEYRSRMDHILSGGGYEVTIKNTDHTSFIDNLNPNLMSDKIRVDHALINKLTLAFLNKHIKQQDDLTLETLKDERVEVKIYGGNQWGS
jgi:dienelactone hydrolase